MMVAGKVLNGIFSAVFMILGEKIIVETAPDYPFKHSEKLLNFVFFTLGVLLNGLLGYFTNVTLEHCAYAILLPSLVSFWRIFYFSMIFKHDTPCYYFNVYVKKLEKNIDKNIKAIEQDRARWDYENYYSNSTTTNTTSGNQSIGQYMANFSDQNQKNSPPGNNNKFSINLNINLNINSSSSARCSVNQNENDNYQKEVYNHHKNNTANTQKKDFEKKNPQKQSHSNIEGALKDDFNRTRQQNYALDKEKNSVDLEYKQSSGFYIENQDVHNDSQNFDAGMQNNTHKNVKKTKTVEINNLVNVNVNERLSLYMKELEKGHTTKNHSMHKNDLGIDSNGQTIRPTDDARTVSTPN